MRKVLIALLGAFCTIFSGIAEKQPLDEFWGLNYTMNRTQVEEIIKTQKGAKTSLSLFNKNRLTVSNVTLDQEEFQYALFEFYNEKLLSGFFSQKTKLNEEATILFLRLRESFTEKYGEPEIETSDIITCYWHDSQQNIAQLSMRKKGKVYLIEVLYLNGKLHSQRMIEDEQLKP